MLSEEWTSEMVLPSAHPTTPTPEAPEMQVMSPLRLKFCMVAFFTKPKSPILLPETYGKTNSSKDKRKSDKSVERKASQPRQAPVKDLLVDLNTADSVMLMSLPHMSKYMASRIVRYKNSLGNFVDVGQLLEVKGIDTAWFQTLVPYLAMSQVEVMKINVNTFEFKSLLKHPYLDYDQVKSIVNYREKRGFITDWEQLCVVLNDKKVNPRLEYYVEF